MTQIRKNKELYNDSAAGTGDWVYSTNKQWDQGKSYSVSWTISSGDTVQIEVTNDVGSDSLVVGSPVVTTSEEFDDTTSGTQVEGTWQAFRVVKTGTNGVLKVIASI